MNPCLEITFRVSPSAAYPDAVRLAESLPGYTVSGTGRHCCHQLAVPLPLADQALWNTLCRLLERIGTWRSTTVRLQEQPVSYPRLASQLAQVQACFARQRCHPRPEDYCSGKASPGSDASHSDAFRPPSSTSGAMSASCRSTNSRSHARGCGSTSRGVSSSTPS